VRAHQIGLSQHEAFEYGVHCSHCPTWDLKKSFASAP